MRKGKLNQIYWIYGGIMGFLLIILEIVKYRSIIRTLDFEIYASIVGSLFLLFGLWLGSHMNKKSSYEVFDNRKLGLSKREIEVLQLLAEGYSNQEIADRLFVSLNTTKTHISNIYTKMNVKRRTQAIQKARIWTMDIPPKDE